METKYKSKRIGRPQIIKGAYIERICFSSPKGSKAQIVKAAKKKGIKTSPWIVLAIQKALETQDEGY